MEGGWHCRRCCAVAAESRSLLLNAELPWGQHSEGALLTGPGCCGHCCPWVPGQVPGWALSVTLCTPVEFPKNGFVLKQLPRAELCPRCPWPAPCPIWGEAKILSSPSASPPKAVFPHPTAHWGLCQAAAPTGKQIHRPGLQPCQREPLLAVPLGFGVFFSELGLGNSPSLCCASAALVFAADDLDMEF